MSNKFFVYFVVFSAEHVVFYRQTSVSAQEGPTSFLYCMCCFLRCFSCRLLWATSFSQSILLSLLLFSFRQTTVSAQCSGMSNECAVWAGRKCKWFAIYDIWLASLGKFLKTSITWVLLLLFQKGSEHMKCILERLRL